MARFFFHVRNDGELISDHDGIDLPGLNEAAREALQSVRELLAEAIKTGKPKVAEAVLVADEAGQIVLEMPVIVVLPEPLRKRVD
jgi:hypothetical protein